MIQLRIKRFFDLLVSGGGLIILSPLLLIISLAIKLESPRDPVIFKQKRLGQDGHLFTLYKFRTLKSGSPMKLNPNGSTQVNRNDPRITGVGRLLRSGVDELPQLWNVLKGDMSIIGPRPDEPFHWDYYTEEEKKKLSIRPGITGLPQIMGRREISWKERIRMDIDYIENYSLWLDLKIAFKTLKVILQGG